MTDPALVLIHSPLVGPMTWRPVADTLAHAGRRAVVPDVSGAMAGGGPYLPAIARLVAAAAAGLAGPVVLVGHSGAGPLLPGIADASPVPVHALLYVDAGLPYPGRSWFQTAPPQLVEQLSRMASGGRLPPWHEWFPAQALAGLLPDPEVRAAFTAQLRPLPVAHFHEPMPETTWPGAAAYLRLSEAYRDDADLARQQGMPVVELSSHHLGMVTSPEAVTAALTDLLVAMGVRACDPGGQAAGLR